MDPAYAAVLEEAGLDVDAGPRPVGPPEAGYPPPTDLGALPAEPAPAAHDPVVIPPAPPGPPAADLGALPAEPAPAPYATAGTPPTPPGPPPIRRRTNLQPFLPPPLDQREPVLVARAWGETALQPATRELGRERKLATGLPDWNPMPPGELLVVSRKATT
jgi:hypothetical protein